jgi:hypothetical protein
MQWKIPPTPKRVKKNMKRGKEKGGKFKRKRKKGEIKREYEK